MDPENDPGVLKKALQPSEEVERQLRGQIDEEYLRPI
jgi:hypothetical protein